MLAYKAISSMDLLRQLWFIYMFNKMCDVQEMDSNEMHMVCFHTLTVSLDLLDSIWMGNGLDVRVCIGAGVSWPVG